jgi:hypothetical protein
LAGLGVARHGMARQGGQWPNTTFAKEIAAMLNRFEETEEVRETVQQLKDHFGHFERGGVIPWGEIEKVLGGSRRDERLWYCIEKFCRWLAKERRIETDKRPHVGGIRYLKHNEVIREVPLMRGRKARRQINRTLKSLDNVDSSACSLAERRLLSAQRHELRHNRLLIGRQYRALQQSPGKTEGNPKRKPPKNEGEAEAA